MAKYTLEDKIRMVKEKKESKLTSEEWCRRNDINSGSFKNFELYIRKKEAEKKATQCFVDQFKALKEIGWMSSENETIRNPSTSGISPHSIKPIKITSQNQTPYVIQVGKAQIYVQEAFDPDSLVKLIRVVKKCF